MSHYDVKLANAHLLFLDTRTFREMHGPDRRGASMLGSRQKQWVKDTMRASDADFFFVVSSVNFMIPHVNPNNWTSGKDDAWTVFPEEREELIQFWDSLGKPVAVLTGDLHNSFAIQVTDRVWEFASGPHNSSNHRANDEAGRPPSGKFDSAGRECDIVWSTYYENDTPRDLARQPVYTVVQVNNVFDSPTKPGKRRWVAFPKPQVVVQFYDGHTGDLMYAQPLLAE